MILGGRNITTLYRGEHHQRRHSIPKTQHPTAACLATLSPFQIPCSRCISIGLSPFTGYSGHLCRCPLMCEMIVHPLERFLTPALCRAHGSARPTEVYAVGFRGLLSALSLPHQVTTDSGMGRATGRMSGLSMNAPMGESVGTAPQAPS